jgi:hypothetical protein
LGWFGQKSLKVSIVPKQYTRVVSVDNASTDLSTYLSPQRRFRLNCTIAQPVVWKEKFEVKKTTKLLSVQA